MLRLQSWWSEYYNRPLKDPLLQEYTLEELLYEYHDKTERKRVAAEKSEEESDKIEDEQLQSNLDWAEEEERKELEKLKEQQEQKKKDKEWMEEQLKKEKEKFGEDFGDDVKIEF